MNDNSKSTTLPLKLKSSTLTSPSPASTSTTASSWSSKPANKNTVFHKIQTFKTWNNLFDSMQNEIAFLCVKLNLAKPPRFRSVLENYLESARDRYDMMRQHKAQLIMQQKQHQLYLQQQLNQNKLLSHQRASHVNGRFSNLSNNAPRSATNESIASNNQNSMYRNAIPNCSHNCRQDNPCQTCSSNVRSLSNKNATNYYQDQDDECESFHHLWSVIKQIFGINLFKQIIHLIDFMNQDIIL